METKPVITCLKTLLIVYSFVFWVRITAAKYAWVRVAVHLYPPLRVFVVGDGGVDGARIVDGITAKLSTVLITGNLRRLGDYCNDLLLCDECWGWPNMFWLLGVSGACVCLCAHTRVRGCVFRTHSITVAVGCLEDVSIARFINGGRFYLIRPILTLFPDKRGNFWGSAQSPLLKGPRTFIGLGSRRFQREHLFRRMQNNAEKT